MFSLLPRACTYSRLVEMLSLMLSARELFPSCLMVCRCAAQVLHTVLSIKLEAIQYLWPHLMLYLWSINSQT